jgi:hypothetical protein
MTAQIKRSLKDAAADMVSGGGSHREGSYLTQIRPGSLGDRAFYSISALAKALGIRRQRIRDAINDGSLKARCLPGGKRLVIYYEDVLVWLNSLPVVDLPEGPRDPRGKGLAT